MRKKPKIANELCFFSHAEFPGFKITPSLYPSRKFVQNFLSTYLKSRKKIDLSTLEKQSQLGGLLSHLHWSLWGVQQTETSEIEWGHKEYAQARINEYWRVKKIVQSNL